jgi:23S rRNA (uracil1939-C5)-methyltransferase
VVDTPEGVVFVPGVLPGERIELEVVGSTRGALRGRLRRITIESELRVEPRCPEAFRCGGCPLMIADARLQRDVKLEFLRDACRGLPGEEETEAQWVPSPLDLGYRRRARFAWHEDTLGYRQPRSRHVQDIADCIVLEPALRTAWSEIRSGLERAFQGDGEIQLERTGDDRVAVSLSTRVDQPPSLFAACDALSRAPSIAGVTLRTAVSGAPASWGDTRLVRGQGDLGLRAPAGSFAQANEGINDALVEEVVALAEPEDARVLELYCGAGNFTVALAAASPAALVAVEEDPRAVEACRDNLKRRCLHARVTVGDANQPPKGRYDVVILDPPRQGARTLFERSGLLPGPKRVVYVSCDTATLGRDLRLATAAGYRIDRAIGFDMFPHTAHLEAVVRLVRA